MGRRNSPDGSAIYRRHGRIAAGRKVHSADIRDRDGIKLVLCDAVCAQLPRMQLLWLDAGYNGRGNGKDWVEQTTTWLVETVRGIHRPKPYGMGATEISPERST